MGWYGPFPDRIGHAVAALMPAETAADGPEMIRPRINVTTLWRSAPGEEPVTAWRFKTAA
jgi:hypothetical protein